jgi:class 3 adenylate cyclase
MYLVAVDLNNPTAKAAVAVNEGIPARVGRNPAALGGERVELLRVTWNDRLVSRNHCEATRTPTGIRISRLPAMTGRSTPNALYTANRPRFREVVEEPVMLQPGDLVVIGAKGNTALFCLLEPDDLPGALEKYHTRLEDEEQDFENSSISTQDYDEVSQLDEYSLRLQLKLLQKDLPEQVLTGWTDDTQLFTSASIFLENALPGQKGVSCGFVGLEQIEEGVGYEILNPDPNARADFRPSRTLLSKIDLEKPNPSDIHIWSLKEHKRVFEAESLGDQVDWVIIIPVSRLDKDAVIYRDGAGRPVFLYVETRQASEAAAASFVPFIRLITSLVASLLSARAEQKLQDQLSAYFSPGLRRLMQNQDQSMLEPAMIDCTVMFADRRGHSRMLERAKSDEEILDRLDENQRVVGLITEEIFRSSGVVTDFAGDGALGLWGWPNLGMKETNHALEAVEAAEAILHRLADRVVYEEELERHMSAVRIGISTGRIAVGRTGPSQQWHISVFGSVANLGARLERIAKEFRIPMLISDETYHRIRGKRGRQFRKLCLIRPAGFDESYPIYELVLPTSVGGSGIGKADVATYENAVSCFVERKWDDAIDLLNSLPQDDPPTLWLKKNALEFRSSPPPESWGGEIQSFSK